MASTIVIEPWQEQSSNETRPYAIDMTAELDTGDVPASATATLTDLLTGASYPTGLLGSPTTGTTAPHVLQSVTALLPGRNYRLSLVVNVGGSKRTETAVKIKVPH